MKIAIFLAALFSSVLAFAVPTPGVGDNATYRMRGGGREAKLSMTIAGFDSVTNEFIIATYSSQSGRTETKRRNATEYLNNFARYQTGFPTCHIADSQLTKVSVKVPAGAFSGCRMKVDYGAVYYANTPFYIVKAELLGYVQELVSYRWGRGLQVNVP